MTKLSIQVPILKFFDRHGKLEVDLSVNNPTSIRNTHMLFCYSQVRIKTGLIERNPVTLTGAV